MISTKSYTEYYFHLDDQSCTVICLPSKFPLKTTPYKSCPGI